MLKTYLKAFENPLIIGAKFAQELLEDQGLMEVLPKESILLLSAQSLAKSQGASQKAMLAYCQELAKECQINILLVSNNPFICLSDAQIYLPGYMGAYSDVQANLEVLLGLILSLKAQDKKRSTLYLLCLSAYIYREAGILARHRFSVNTLLAQDIIKHIPEVMNSLNH